MGQYLKDMQHGVCHKLCPQEVLLLILLKYIYLWLLAFDSKDGSMHCCSNETAYTILDIYFQSTNRKQQAPWSKKDQKEKYVLQVSVSNLDLFQSSSLLNFSFAFSIYLNKQHHLPNLVQICPMESKIQELLQIPSFSLVSHVQSTSKSCRCILKMSIFFYVHHYYLSSVLL